jgi:hypothetical protein
LDGDRRIARVEIFIQTPRPATLGRTGRPRR